jgi:hypothetical protein
MKICPHCGNTYFWWWLHECTNHLEEYEKDKGGDAYDSGGDYGSSGFNDDDYFEN